MIGRCAPRRWPLLSPPAPSRSRGGGIRRLESRSNDDRRHPSRAARRDRDYVVVVVGGAAACPPSFRTSSSWSTSASTSTASGIPQSRCPARPRAGGGGGMRGGDDVGTTTLGSTTTNGGPRRDDGGRLRDEKNGRVDRHVERVRAGRHRRSRHSTRLIGEDAARRTTELFLDAHDRSIRRRRVRGRRRGGERSTDVVDDDDMVWRDATALLAAEQALEFWANNRAGRYDGDDDDDRRGNRRDGRDGRRGNGRRNEDLVDSTAEDDAEMALRLFAALHHFHLLLNDEGIHRRDGGGGGSRRRRDGRDAVLTNGMYSHVVDALARSTNPEHVRAADALLRQFISLCVGRRDGGEVDDANANARSDEDNAPAESAGIEEARRSSNRTIATFERPGALRWNDGDGHHFPNQIRITGVMRGYARQSRPRHAERLLDLMTSLSSSSSSASGVDRRDRAMFRPNDVGYATVIDAYSRSRDGPNAERVLGTMKRRGLGGVDDDDDGRDDNRANVVAYNAAVSAWARSAKGRAPRDGGSSCRTIAAPTKAEISSSRSAAENAERLLREMWDEHDRCRTNDGRRRSALLPDVVTYSSVISAYATCLDQPHGIGRARELLAELEGLAARELDELHRREPTGGIGRNSTGFGSGGGGGRHPHGFRPNTLTYNTLLQAYANAGDATSAEGLLRSMISLHSSSLKEEGGGGRFRHVRPNTRTFNVVLNALAKGEGGDGGIRASQLLERLVELGSENGGPRPDVISYNTVLAAWSKSASVCPESPPTMEDGAHQRTRVVGELAANEALKLLDEIEDRYMQSLESKTDSRSLAVKPDVISYNTTIAAFANAAQHSENGTSMAWKTEEILSRMIGLGIEPDAYSYNGVLLAWARSSGGLPAAKHAETILRSMKEPTIISWSTVVSAYAHADGAQMAEALLREMEENASGQSKGYPKSIVPSIILYNNVLHSWGVSSHGDASRNAEALLNRMEGSSPSPAPDAISYRLVLNALEHTKDHDKAERAKSVLDRLLAFELHKSSFKPHEIQNAYNSVLTACAYTPVEAGEHHRNNAARILVETLREMNQFPWYADDKSSGPNQETYAHFVQGCIHLYGPMAGERNELLKSAFCECCQKGLLNRVIWDKFCVAIGPEGVQEFIGQISSAKGQKGPSYDELPEEWFSKFPRSESLFVE